MKKGMYDTSESLLRFGSFQSLSAYGTYFLLFNYMGMQVIKTNDITRQKSNVGSLI